MRTLRLALLDPGSETVLTGQLAAGGAHSGFLDCLETDVALQERSLLPAAYS